MWKSRSDVIDESLRKDKVSFQLFLSCFSKAPDSKFWWAIELGYLSANFPSIFYQVLVLKLNSIKNFPSDSEPHPFLLEFRLPDQQIEFNFFEVAASPRGNEFKIIITLLYPFACFRVRPCNQRITKSWNLLLLWWGRLILNSHRQTLFLRSLLLNDG